MVAKVRIHRFARFERRNPIQYSAQFLQGGHRYVNMGLENYSLQESGNDSPSFKFAVDVFQFTIFFKLRLLEPAVRLQLDLYVLELLKR